MTKKKTKREEEKPRDVPWLKLPDRSEVLRVPENRFSEPGMSVSYRYPGTPDKLPRPVGVEIPRVHTYVAEVVDEFMVHVEMQYKPVRRPSRVNLSITETGATGDCNPHRKEIRPLPMTPKAARKLAKLLTEASDMAEEMDTKPYPPPEESAPPLVEE